MWAPHPGSYETQETGSLLDCRLHSTPVRERRHRHPRGQVFSSKGTVHRTLKKYLFSLFWILLEHNVGYLTVLSLKIWLLTLRKAKLDLRLSWASANCSDCSIMGHVGLTPRSSTTGCRPPTPHLTNLKNEPVLYLDLELTIHIIKSQIHLVRQSH